MNNHPIPTMRNQMKTYWFEVFLSGIDEMTDEIADALFEVGCDGTPGSREGHAQVCFAREADSLESAICSALDEIKKAGFNFSKVEIDPESLHELYSQARCVA